MAPMRISDIVPQKAAFDPVIGCVVERAHLDAYGTSVIVTEVGEAFRIINTRITAVASVDGGFVDCIRGTLTDAYTTGFAEVCHPGVVIVGAEGHRGSLGVLFSVLIRG